MKPKHRRHSYHPTTKRDGNHKEIVERYEAHACDVADTSACGGSVPDIIVGYMGFDFMREIKNPEGRNRLDEGQRNFHRQWRGATIKVIRTVEDVDDDIEQIRAWAKKIRPMEVK